MARPREPINLIVAKGKKHLGADEIEARRAAEVQPATDDITPPSFLTAAQKKKFVKLADQLLKIKIIGETDCETLARYVTAQTQYEDTTKELRAMKKDKPKQEDFDEMALYYGALDLFYKMEDSLIRRQDRYFKQAQATARDLGLTISSRCKLQVPVKEEKEAPVNKFAKFGAAGGGSA